MFQRICNIVLVMVLGLGDLGWAAATIVQTTLGHSAVSSTTLAVTVTSTGSGNLLVLGSATPFNSVTVSSISGGCSGSWTQATGAAGSDSWFGSETDVWYCLSSSSGATTVTITYSGSSDNKTGIVWEVSGMTSPSLDDADHVNDGTAATITGPTLTSTGSDMFAVGMTATASGVTEFPASGNAFSSGGARSGDWDASGISLATTTSGSHTPVWTTGATGHWSVSAAVFKSAGGGGAGAKGLMLLGVGP